MTTVTALRTTHLNGNLGRQDGSVAPWTDAQCDQAITDALTELWPIIGKRASGTVVTSHASDVYAIPAALAGGTISRISLEQASGGITSRADRVTNWIRHSDTEVLIRPRLPTDSTLALRFHGWVPFAVDGSDLPTRLEHVVATKAASLAYGMLAGFLTNSQRQQGLDQGRVVDQSTAVGMAAYWERRYQESIRTDQNRVSYAPRAARR